MNIMKRNWFLIFSFLVVIFFIFLMFQGGFVFLLGLVMISVVINGIIEFYFKRRFSNGNDYKNKIYKVGDSTNRILFVVIVIISFINSFYITIDGNQILVILLSVLIVGEILFFFLYRK